MISRRAALTGQELEIGKVVWLVRNPSLVSVACLAVTALNAQSPDALAWQAAVGGKASFEVASVRPTKIPSPKPATFPLDNRDAYVPGGRFFASFPLWDFISFAYKLSAADQSKADYEQLPKWTATNFFDIEARAEGNPTKDQMRLMMQSLLAERFKLAAHFETREGPVFALTLVKPGKLGPKLRPHSEGPACPDSYTPQAPGPPIPNAVFPPNCGDASMQTRNGVRTIGSRNITVALVADAIQRSGVISGEVDKPVLDKTGLSGRFDFTIEYTPGQYDLIRPRGANTDPPPDPNPEGAPFLNAVRDQLGLKLVRSTGPIRRLIIDHVEWPSEN